MKNLLVVVDMVNGFVKEGALADRRIEKIIPAIQAKIEMAKKNGDMIIDFRDSHTPSDEELKFYPPHCLKGTVESELIDELKSYAKDMIDIEKDTTNGFKTDKMKEIIKNNHFDNIDITGCCTDICVRDLTHSLLKYFAQNGINTSITIDEDCVDTFNNPSHNADEINESTIKEFRELGVMGTSHNDKLVPMKVRKLTDGKWLNMFEVTYKGEDGDIRYEMVSRRELPEVVKPSLNPDAVHIIPYSYVNGSMMVYLIKEFRYPVGDYVYAVPAGLVNKGENSKDSAIRELEEEIGAKVINIERTETSSYSSVGMTDERAEMFEAEVKLNGKQHLDKGERIEVLPVKLEELEALLESEKFGARSKYGLRSFVLKQKIKALEKEIAELRKGEEPERGDE